MSVAGWANHNGQCNGAYFSDIHGEWWNVQVTAQYDILLMQTLGTLYIDDDTVITNAGVRCTFSHGYCFDALQGEVVWDIMSQDSCEAHKFSVLFEGTGTLLTRYDGNTRNILDKIIVVEEQSTSFA